MKKLFIILISCSIIFTYSVFAGCNKNGDLPQLPEVETPDNSPSNPSLPNEPGDPDFPNNPNEPENPVSPNSPEIPNIPEVPETPPEPTPPVNPIPKGDVLVMSTTAGLTVRSGRGTSFSAVGSLDKGDMLDYVAEDNGWYEVVFKKKRAYVSSTYAKLVGFTKGNAAVERVVEEGKKLLGIPYVYGAERYHWGNGSLNTKFTGSSYDCSSLVQYIYKIGANVNIATTSREQSVQGTSVSKSNLRRGDLMYFTNDTRFHLTGIDRIGHVAMYLGDNYILHTASDHAVIEEVSSKRWSYLINSRRLV